MWMLIILCISFVQSLVMNIMMLNSMNCAMFQIMEKVVKLMFNLMHNCCTTMEVNIMLIISTLIMPVVVEISISMVTNFKAATVGVIRCMLVLIVVHIVCMCVVKPVIGSVFDTVRIVVFINVLRIVLTIVTIGVIVAEMMIFLRLMEKLSVRYRWFKGNSGL